MNAESNISVDFIDTTHDLDVTIVNGNAIKDKCGGSLDLDMHLGRKSIMPHNISHVEFVLSDYLNKHGKTILNDHLLNSLENLTLTKESHIDFVGCSRILVAPTLNVHQFILGSS